MLQLLSQPFPQPVEGEQPLVVSQEPLRHSVPHSVGASSGHWRHTPLTQAAPLGQHTSPHTVSPAPLHAQLPMRPAAPVTGHALDTLQQVVRVHAEGNSAGHAAQNFPPVTGCSAITQVCSVGQQTVFPRPRQVVVWVASQVSVCAVPCGMVAWRPW